MAGGGSGSPSPRCDAASSFAASAERGGYVGAFGCLGVGRV